MRAPIGRLGRGSRGAKARRELALDLTPDEVVLYEGSPAAGWRRFAGVALDDPEFMGVLTILRTEAEAALGRQPVRLWLPAAQVLEVRLRLRETDADARLRAAFARITRETGHHPDDVALAVSPPGADGRSVLLVTYADTWAEARAYARRWGFLPGPVSTRHSAAAFGPAGPEFQPRTALPPVPERPRRRLVPWLGLAMAALVAGVPGPAWAGKAPGAAPLPSARAVSAVPAAAVAALPQPAFVPVARPATGTRSGPGKRAAPAATGEAEPLAAPLPPARPRAAAPRKVAAAAPALPPIGAAAPPSVRVAAVERGLPPDHAALIGILSLESGRKALLRLPNGDYRALRVGDVLEGWRVSAIGLDAMRVSKGGEDRTLLLVTR